MEQTDRSPTVAAGLTVATSTPHRVPDESGEQVLKSEQLADQRHGRGPVARRQERHDPDRQLAGHMNCDPRIRYRIRPGDVARDVERVAGDAKCSGQGLQQGDLGLAYRRQRPQCSPEPILVFHKDHRPI